MTPRSERDLWPEALCTAWDAASVTDHRAWLAYRLSLRQSLAPENTPVPLCPVRRALRTLELAYRRHSECRGIVLDPI